MFMASSSSSETKQAAELDSIAVLKKLRLLFMNNKYRGAESRDCDLYNNVLEAHQAILVYVEDEEVHNLWVNDEPLEPKSAIKIISKMIESLQLSTAQSIAETPNPPVRTVATPVNIDIKANAERDVIAIAGSVTSGGMLRIGGGDTVINNPVYGSNKGVLDEATLDLKEKQALAQLKAGYVESKHASIQGIFGIPLQLDGQYINLQMLCVDLKNKKTEEDKESKDSAETKCDEKYKDARMASVEDLFGDKWAIKTEDLFKPEPDQALLSKQELQPTGQKEDNLQRLLLVQGRAGIGKTTFVRYVGYQWGKGQLYAEYTWVFTLTLRELRLLSNNQELSLSEWIRRIQFSDWPQTEFDALWRQRIEPAINQNKVILILDGYDEVPENHPCQSVLKDLLTAVGIYANFSLLITTRPCSAEGISENRRNLEIIGFTDKNIHQYIQTYFLKALNKTLVHTLTETLRKQPIIWANAHIPLNLNLLCGIMEEAIQKAHLEGLTQGLVQLSSMTRLYQVMEKKLYERSHSRHDVGSLKPGERWKRERTDFVQHYHKERLFLAELAFQSFKAERIIIPKQIIGDALQNYVDNAVPQGSQRNIQRVKEKLWGKFFDDVCQLGLIKPVLDKSGLSQAQQDYEFLHLTFQEYYTAIYLMEGLSSEEPEVKIDAEKVVLKEKYNPRWQIVWWFVAGLLRENSSAYKNYLQQLQNQYGSKKPGRDIFEHYQLGLLARCVDEGLQPNNQQVIKPIIEQLQRRFLNFYQIAKNLTNDNKEKSELRNIVMNLALTKSSFFLACRMSPKICMNETEDLYALIPKAYKSQDKHFFLAWIVATGITTPKALCMLGQLLADSDEEVRQCAFRTVHQLGQAIVTREFLFPLTKLLVDLDSTARDYDAGLVARLGRIVATPSIIEPLTRLLADADIKQEFLVSLAKLLVDVDSTARCYAAELVVKLGEIAVIPLIIELLTKLLTDPDESVRCSAAQAFSKLGTAVVTPLVSEAFMKLLGDTHEATIRSALEVFCQLGTVTAIPQFFGALTKLLASENSDRQSFAAIMIGNLGALAATPEVLQGLARLLGDKKKTVRLNAVEAVRKMAAAAATPAFLCALSTLLKNKNSDVRISAAGVIGNLGTAAETPAFLSALSTLLKDKNSDVRISAAGVIGNLGALAATPLISRALIKCLTGKNYNACRPAAGALARLATPQILEVLATLLGDKEDDVRRNAVYALSSMDTAAAPQILGILAKLLTSEDIYENRCGNYINDATRDFFEILGKVLANIENYTHTFSVERTDKLSINMMPHILAALVPLLTSENSSVCDYVAGSLCRLGTATLTPQIIDMLPQLLANKEHSVRRYSADMICKLDTRTMLQISKAVTRLLMNKEHSVRRRAAGGVCELGTAAATPEMLEALTNLLADENKDVRLSAAETVKKMITAVEAPKILKMLPQLLMDEEHNVRRCASEMVAKLGIIAGTPEILDVLTRMLVDENKAVRSLGAETVSNLGTTAAVPQILKMLPQLSVDEEYSVRRFAADMVGKMGIIAGTPEVLNVLTRMVVDENKTVRSLAVETVSNLGTAAVVPQQILEVLPKLLTDADHNVRFSAARAVGNLGIASMTSPLLEMLAHLFVDKECSVRYCALQAVNKLGATATSKCFDTLMRLLTHENSDIRRYAVEAVDNLDTLILRPQVLEMLAKLLGDEDSEVRMFVVRVVGKAGSSALTPEILDALVQVLVDKEYRVCTGAAKVLVKLGVAMTPQVLTPLADLLANISSDVRYHAVEAVDRLGVAAEPNIVKALVRLLGRDEDSNAQSLAGWTIARLSTTVMSQILSELIQLLSDENSKVNRCAAQAVNRFGAVLKDELRDAQNLAGWIGNRLDTAVIPQVLKGLMRLLSDENSKTRCCAAEAVGELGATIAVPQILDVLARLLSDEDRYVRRSVVKTLSKLGSAAVTPQILDALPRLLEDKDRNQYSFYSDRPMCCYAAEAVGKLGAAAGRPQILKPLAQLLADEDKYVRGSAAQALGKLGSAVATPQILDVLAGLAVDKDDSVRRYVVEAMIKLLDTAIPTPHFLEAVTKLCRNQDRGVRDSAVKLMSKIGKLSPTPKFFSNLVMLFENNDSDVRNAAGEMICKLATVPTPQIFDILMKLLKDTGWNNIRSCALEAVGKLGVDAATPELLDVLADLLADKNLGNVRLSVAKTVNKLGAAIAKPLFIDKLIGLLAHTNRDMCFSTRDVIIQLGTAVFVPRFLDGLTKLLIGADKRRVYWVARDIIQKLDAIAMQRFLYGLLEIFSVADSKNNLLNAFEVCIDSIFPLFPSFWTENANHPNILDFVSHTLAAAYLNSHISCQIDFDKEAELNKYYMRSFVGKSPYLCSITPLQAQYLSLLSSMIMDQLSKTGKLDILALKRNLPEGETGVTVQAPYANERADTSSVVWVEPLTYMRRSNANSSSQSSVVSTEEKQVFRSFRERPKPVKTNNGSGF